MILVTIYEMHYHYKHQNKLILNISMRFSHKCSYLYYPC